MEQEFVLQTEVRGLVLVMSTSGYINNVGGEAISKEFARHFDNGIKNVVLNLHGSKVVNSIGISFLIDILDRLNDADGKLVFTNLDPAVEKMLSIMGLLGIAGKENTVDEAMRVLGNA
jgi:anti-anti-sigma factor